MFSSDSLDLILRMIGRDCSNQPEGLMARLHRRSNVSEEIPEEPELPVGQLLMPIVMLIFMSFLLLNEGLRNGMASLAGGLLEPALPHEDKYFVPTVLLLGSTIMIVNTLFRSLFMDPIAQAHLNHRNRQLRKLMQDARLSRDHVRLEKISKMQLHLMPETTKLQMSMMKPMMFTMVFILGIFSWMYVMVDDFRVAHVSLPWAPQWSFNDRVIIFPAWIAAYITLSAPLGRVVDRHIRLLRYRTHPMVLSGETLDEPLLVLLKEKKRKKQGSRRTQRSQRRMRGSKDLVSEEADVPTAPRSRSRSHAVEGLNCPSCTGSEIVRTSSGRMRCQICFEEWRR